MNLITGFKNLINDINPITIILIVYGLVLIFTAFIKSTYLIFSFLGSCSIIASIILRVLNGGDITQVFIMIFFIIAIITVFFLLTVRFSKYGWILRVPVSKIENGIKEIHIKKRT